MKFADLYKAEYNVWKVRAFPQTWQAGKTYYYTNHARPASGLLLFRQGHAVCHTADGDLEIQCGAVFFDYTITNSTMFYSRTFKNNTI